MSDNEKQDIDESTETVAEDTLISGDGKVEAYYRVNLTSNSKSTNIDTTASLRFSSHAAVKAVFGQAATPDAALAALLSSAFDIGRIEAVRRGKPLVEIQPLPEMQPLEDFEPIPELSDIRVLGETPVTPE